MSRTEQVRACRLGSRCPKCRACRSSSQTRRHQRHGLPAAQLPAGVYRFRMLNGTQSRVWNLQLYNDEARRGSRTSARKDPTSSRSAPRAASCPRRRSCRRAIQFDRDNVPTPTTRPATAWCSAVPNEPTCSSTSRLCRTELHPVQRRAGAVPGWRRRATTTTRGTGDAGRAAAGRNTRTLMRITITGAGCSGPDDGDVRLLAALNAALAQKQLGLLGPTTRSSGRCSTSTSGSTPRGPRLSTRASTRTGASIQMLGTDPSQPTRAARATGCTTWTRSSRHDEKYSRGRYRSLGHLQHDGRHTPDPLPPGERPDPRPGAVRAGRGR